MTPPPNQRKRPAIAALLELTLGPMTADAPSQPSTL